MSIRECDCKEFQDSGHTDECNEHYKLSSPPKDSRKAFEEWVTNIPGVGTFSIARRENGDYDSSHTHLLWLAWQTSRASVRLPQSDTNLNQNGESTELKPCPFCGGKATAITGYLLSKLACCVKRGCPGNRPVPEEDWNIRATITDQARWCYCPECGASDYQRAYGGSPGERVCNRCTQSWWPDVDYTDTVRSHLADLKAKQETSKPEESGWQPIETAPKDESVFLLRNKKKLTVIEASFFWDQEFMDGHPITERYLCLHDMTKDEPIEQGWDEYEWMPCPTTEIEGEKP